MLSVLYPSIDGMARHIIVMQDMPIHTYDDHSRNGPNTTLLRDMLLCIGGAYPETVSHL